MKILIMGLGHLASFLVEQFKHESYSLWGTHRHAVKKETFHNVQTIHFDGAINTTEPFKAFQCDFDVIIWNFPPFENYLQSLLKAHNFFPKEIPWIFVSSTSVFDKSCNHAIDETFPKKESLLSSIEALLQSMDRKVTIVRPGGLVDSIRHPGNFFKKHSLVKGANTPVNLVHTHDVARFIKHIIDNAIFEQDFNLVSSMHPSKQEFYQRMLVLLGYNGPEWDEKESLNSYISNEKSLEIGFQYQFNDLVAYFHNIR